MHESMERLFSYVKHKTQESNDPIRELSDLRARLDVSAAVFTNWKKRGISKEGALAAEERWGCSANWLLTDVGTPASMTTWPFDILRPEHIERLSPKDLRTVEKLALSLLDELENPSMQDDAYNHTGASVRGATVWKTDVRRGRRDGATDQVKGSAPGKRRAG